MVLLSELSHAKRLQKMVFTASLDAQHKRDSVENKPVSLLVVSFDKALNGMPPFLCGRQVVGAKLFYRLWWLRMTKGCTSSISSYAGRRKTFRCNC